jgi:hypothetical protein
MLVFSIVSSPFVESDRSKYIIETSISMFLYNMTRGKYYRRNIVFAQKQIIVSSAYVMIEVASKRKKEELPRPYRFLFFSIKKNARSESRYNLGRTFFVYEIDIIIFINKNIIVPRLISTAVINIFKVTRSVFLI